MLGLLAAAALAPPAASAQSSAQRSVLLVLDASKSMNEPAGNGGSRLDAAKAAVDDLVGVLPSDVQVGLRVYGARVAEAGRRVGCRDTQLVVPVGPLDRDALSSRVNALEGKGRTPIGRSLRAAAGDLPAGGRRTVVLVSDGGDNCAPPDPCRAAAAVAKRGVDLTISVIGLQVDERARRQLRCIADAGGGTYVDAGDADALRSELLATIARAFRGYKPVGTPVQGGPQREQAAPVGDGQYVDSVVSGGDQRWYAVAVKPAQRLFAAATVIPPRGSRGVANLHMELIGPDVTRAAPEANVLAHSPASAGQFGSVTTASVRTPQVAARGVPSNLQPGTYWLHVWLTAGLTAEPIPLELAVQPLDPGERPAFVRAPGPLSSALGAVKPPAAAGTPTPAPTAAAPAEAGGTSPSAPALAGVGVGGLLVGLLGGRLALRRRRP